MIKRFLVLALLVVSFQATAASKAGTAVFESNEAGSSGTMRFEYLNEKTSRMNVEGEQGADSYMLFRDGKATVVTHTQGQTLVMDMEKMMKMASGFGAASGQSTQSFTSSVKSMTATGKKETVAGIKGEIYQLEWIENGQSRTDELVLSKDKKARAYTRAWMNAVRAMQKAGAEKEIKGDHLVARLEKKKMGILRLGDRFELKSIKSNKPDAARFEVPEATMEIPNMGAILGGATGAAAAGAAASGSSAPEQSSGGLWGSLKDKFNKKSERQVDRQASSADNAVDRATDTAVDTAVEKSVKNIFGRIFK